MPNVKYLTAPVDPLVHVRQSLQASEYACIRRLRCEYLEGVVALHGRVTSYYLKQVAQEIVRRTAGVEEVANRIEVVERKQA